MGMMSMMRMMLKPMRLISPIGSKMGCEEIGYICIWKAKQGIGMEYVTRNMPFGSPGSVIRIQGTRWLGGIIHPSEMM
jgi:hypothetical protein